MHLINLLIHLSDPAIHLLIIAIVLFVSTHAFSNTPFNDCPFGMFMNSELANTGGSCSAVAFSSLTGTPSFAPIATSGVYADLTGKPSIPAAQLQSDWNEANTGLLDYIKNKPSLLSYENTTQRINPILVNKTAVVSGGAGNAVFNITNDGTSTGTALCPNGTMLNSPNLSVNDATAPYQFSWAWSNSNKTMTVLSQKASGLAVLTFTLLGIPAPVPNGTSVNATLICY